MDIEKYKKEAIERAKDIEHKRMSLHIHSPEKFSTFNDGEKDFLVVYQRSNIEGCSKFKAVFFPIEDGKLGRNGLFFLAESRPRDFFFPILEGSHETSCVIGLENSNIIFKHSDYSIPLDVRKPRALCFFIRTVMEENSFTEQKDLALKLCKKFLITSKFDKQKPKSRFTLLRNIVERHHELGKPAGKLHKKAVKRKIQEKIRLEKEREKKDKLQRKMTLARKLDKFTK